MKIIAAQPYLIALLNFMIAGQPESPAIDSGEIVDILYTMARSEALRIAQEQNCVSAA